MINTNGSMRLIFQQGFTNTGMWAVTSVYRWLMSQLDCLTYNILAGTSIAQGVSLSAVFSIPDLSSASASVSTTATIINDNTNQYVICLAIFHVLSTPCLGSPLVYKVRKHRNYG